MTLNDLEGHSPVAGVANENEMRTFRTVSTDTTRQILKIIRNC